MTDRNKPQTETDLSQLTEDELDAVQGAGVFMGWIMVESVKAEPGSADGDKKGPVIGAEQNQMPGAKLR